MAASKAKFGLGGVVHTYQKYDPRQFPNPLATSVDIVSPMLDRLLAFGSARWLSEEELARAVRLDPNLFNPGPSLDAIQAILLERKRRILETYESETVQQTARKAFHRQAKQVRLPEKLRPAFRAAIDTEQLVDLEEIWYQLADDSGPVAGSLVGLIERLGEKYQVDELAGKYTFVGRQPMTVPQALELKAELERIDELLKQLESARENAQIGYIDLDELSQFVEPGDIQQLEEMQRLIENYVREAAERHGLEADGRGQFRLTPKALRIFQSKLLSRIFSELQPGRSGRHTGNVMGDGAVELPTTKPYEFGDSIANIDLPQTFVNSLVRHGPGLPIRLDADDIVVHRTRNHPKSATVVIMDMSGSMRYDGQYIQVKRMALALDGLIRSEYPGDYLGFVEMYTFAKVRRAAEIIELMPKPVTLHQPRVRLKFDMSSPQASEHWVHPHFTNIQQALSVSRRLLAAQNTPNRQIVLITDGLPTAHFEESQLFLLYPPHPVTESWTLREALLCQQAGITLNLFLVPSWSQTEDDVQFAQRLAQSTKGRVFFTGGNDLDRFVVWDYVKRKRDIIG